MLMLPIEARTAAWKPPTLTKSLARTVAKRLDKHWAQTGVKSLQDIRDALGSGVAAGMSMADRIEHQAAIKKWSKGLPKADLHKMFRMVEEIKNGKAREQYRKTDDALAGLRAASDDLLPSERHTSKAAASYLDMFFKEKRIPSKTFDVTDSQGITHSIPNKVVIDMIKQTRGSERKSIEDTLRKIDFANGDVNHFLAHLAKGLAESYKGALRLASEQEAEKLQAEAEANEQQAQADRAKAEAAQMREASSPYHARDVDQKLRDISESLIEDDHVSILDPRKKLNSRHLTREIQEDLADELSNQSMTPRNPGGDVIEGKDIDLDVEWSENIDDGIPGWEVGFSHQGHHRWASREAAQASGLYGYTKGTQRDVEASVRKAQRRAASVAKILYAKDERSVDFLKAHVKRANSKSARLILSAMKVIGPRVASDKTAALLPSERHASIFHGSPKEQLEYVVDALRLAGKQGLRVDALPRKGALAAQEKGFADAERGQLFITSKGKSVRLASGVTLPIERAAAHVEIGKAEMDALHKDGKAEIGEHTISFKEASEKVAGGLYGHPTKTARLALVACSDLRAYVGEVAYSLHSRRTAKYAKVTGFLKEHGKTSKCAYSRMLLDCYPDAPASKQAAWPGATIGAIGQGISNARAQAGIEAMSDEEAKEKYPWDECLADQMKQYGDKETAEKVCGKIKSQSQGKSAASEMLKKAFVPDSVDGWVEWADGTRTAAHKEA